jgi:hypothetical protein
MTDAIHSIDASALKAPGCAAYQYMQGSYQPFLRGPFHQFAETRPGDPETAFNFLTGVGGSCRSSNTASVGCTSAPTASGSTQACRSSSAASR